MALAAASALLLLEGCGTIVDLEKYHVLPRPAKAWTKQFGSSGFDAVYSIQVDGSGNVFVAGRVEGTLPGQVSAGSADAFLRKYDFEGNEVWTKQFGTAGPDLADSLRVDAEGNLFVAAVGGTSDTFGDTWYRTARVAKFDTTGTELWSRSFDTTEEIRGLTAVGVGESSDLLVAGQTLDTLPRQPAYVGEVDMFVRRYGPNGAEIWTQKFGSEGHDAVFAMIVDGDGNIFVAGEVQGALPGREPHGGVDGFIRKYDARGSHFWTRQLGTPGDDYVNALSLDQDGNLLAGGTQDYVGFVSKYDASGELIWTREFGDVVESVSVDEAGNVVAVGTTREAPSEGKSPEGCFEIDDICRDVSLRRYDSDGVETWNQQLGSSADDIPLSVTLDTSGSVLIAGYAFGALPGQTHSGAGDAFVMSLVMD